MIGEDDGHGAVSGVGDLDGLEAPVLDALGTDDRIDDGDLGAAPLELLQYLDRCRLTVVGDVRLVGDAGTQDPGSEDGESSSVEQIGDSLGDVPWHRRVDLLGGVDEPRGELRLAGSPCQELRVEGNAMAPDAGPRIERLEPERFGCRRLDDLPQVDVELVRELRHLVDEGDVHRPIGVLQQLRHLGGPSRRHDVNIGEDASVCGCSDLPGRARDSADHLRDRSGCDRPARIHPLRRERDECVPVDLEAGVFDGRHDEVVGGSGVARRFE